MLPPLLASLQQSLQDSPTPATARQVIEEYLAFISPASFRQELWELTAALLTHSEMPNASTARDRADILFFYEFTSLFAEAVNCIAMKRSERTAS